MTDPADDGRSPLSTYLAALVAIVAVIAAVAYLGLRDTDGDAAPGTVAGATSSATPSGDVTVPTEAPTTAAAGAVTVGSCTYNPDGQAARDVTPPTEADLRTGTVKATLQTSVGTITLDLDGAKAPCATASFVSLARQGFYNDTTCHRVIDGSQTGGGSIAQCGDPLGTGAGGPGYVYGEENTEGATYARGTVAMAKTQAPGTTGSQFFLVTQDASFSPDYTVLGTITGGLDALDAAIAKGVKPGTESSAGGGQPVEPIDITSVTTSG